MANIGDQLTAPESGMQRIDDRNNKIIYNGTFIQKDDTNKYNNTSTYTTTLDDSIEFYFYGTKFYIIDMLYNTRSNNNIVEVDGIVNGTWNGYNASATTQKILVYKVENLEEKIHKVKITNGSTTSKTTMLLDAIDIDDNGRMCTADEYLQQENVLETPVKIGDETIESEDDVKAYAETIVNGERQLLVSDKLKGMYVTDGKGGYVKIIDESTTDHNNRDVLDLLSTDGSNLFFKGKNVQKVELEDGQYGYSTTIMNALADNVYAINITNGSTLCEQIVQAWEFTEGNTDVTTVAKTFNNAEKDNFYYDGENGIEFTDTVCKVKDTFTLDSTLNDTTGIYEIPFNKAEFIELISLDSEVNN